MASESLWSSDEDEEHNAALRSVAIDSHAVLQFAMPLVQISTRKCCQSKFSRTGSANVLEDEHDKYGNGTRGLKLYQTRVQDLLQKHLDNFFKESLLEVKSESENAGKSDDPAAEDEVYDEEIRLYRNGPLGVSLKRSRPLKDSQGRLLPSRYDSSDEDAAKQESRLEAAAIDGSTVKYQAEISKANTFTRLLAVEEAFKREERAEAERVKRLKQERGEKWLPSVAKEIRREVVEETQKRKTMSSEGKIGVVAKYEAYENVRGNHLQGICMALETGKSFGRMLSYRRRT